MTHAQDYKQTNYGIKASIATKSTDVEIQWFSPQTVRVLKTPINATIDKKNLSVIASPQKNSATVKQDGNTIIMESKKIRVNVDLKSGVVSFCTKDGSQLLSETENNKAFTPFNDADRKTYCIYQGYDTDDNEALYGLGQLQNGKMSQRGIRKVLVQGNQEDVTPYFQSTKGYGIFWDNYSATTYDDTKDETSFSSVVGDCIDYYFMYGGSANGVIAQTRRH